MSSIGGVLSTNLSSASMLTGCPTSHRRTGFVWTSLCIRGMGTEISGLIWVCHNTLLMIRSLKMGVRYRTARADDLRVCGGSSSSRRPKERMLWYHSQDFRILYRRTPYTCDLQTHALHVCLTDGRTTPGHYRPTTYCIHYSLEGI